MPNITAARAELRPWEQGRDESRPAYQAFLTYRDAGAERSLATAAQALKKNYALIRRWAKRFSWGERAWAWDLSQRQEEEEAVRRQRTEMVQRQLKDADRLQRLAMAKLSDLVRRDPETGELTLSREVSVQDATRLYQLSLAIARHLPAPAEPEAAAEAESAEAQLRRLSSQELQQIIPLIKERANQHAEVLHDDEDAWQHEEENEDEGKQKRGQGRA